jgi:hypothetical protein
LVSSGALTKSGWGGLLADRESSPFSFLFSCLASTSRADHPVSPARKLAGADRRSFMSDSRAEGLEAQEADCDEGDLGAELDVILNVYATFVQDDADAGATKSPGATETN